MAERSVFLMSDHSSSSEEAPEPPSTPPPTSGRSEEEIITASNAVSPPIKIRGATGKPRPLLNQDTWPSLSAPLQVGPPPHSTRGGLGQWHLQGHRIPPRGPQPGWHQHLGAQLHHSTDASSSFPYTEFTGARSTTSHTLASQSSGPSALRIRQDMFDQVHARAASSRENSPTHPPPHVLDYQHTQAASQQASSQPPPAPRPSFVEIDIPPQPLQLGQGQCSPAHPSPTSPSRRAAGYPPLANENFDMNGELEPSISAGIGRPPDGAPFTLAFETGNYLNFFVGRDRIKFWIPRFILPDLPKWREVVESYDPRGGLDLSHMAPNVFSLVMETSLSLGPISGLAPGMNLPAILAAIDVAIKWSFHRTFMHLKETARTYICARLLHPPMPALVPDLEAWYQFRAKELYEAWLLAYDDMTPNVHVIYSADSIIDIFLNAIPSDMDLSSVGLYCRTFRDHLTYRRTKGVVAASLEDFFREWVQVQSAIDRDPWWPTETEYPPPPPQEVLNMALRDMTTVPIGPLTIRPRPVTPLTPSHHHLGAPSRKTRDDGSYPLNAPRRVRPQRSDHSVPAAGADAVSTQNKAGVSASATPNDRQSSAVGGKASHSLKPGVASEGARTGSDPPMDGKAAAPKIKLPQLPGKHGRRTKKKSPNSGVQPSVPYHGTREAHAGAHVSGGDLEIPHDSIGKQASAPQGEPTPSSAGPGQPDDQSPGTQA